MKTKLQEKFEKIRKIVKLQSGGIQMMITGAFSIVAVIMIIVLSLIFYNLYSQRIFQMKTESTEQFLNQTKHGLEDYLRSNRRVSDTLYYTCIKNRNLDQESIDDELNLIYESNKDNIVSISLYSESGKLMSAVPVVTQNNEKETASKEWFKKAVKEVENLHFSTPYVQNISADALDGYRWVISLSRSVELNRGGRLEQGVLVIDMKYSTIQQMIDKVNADDSSEYIYLSDGNGDIIYHPKRLWMNAGHYKEQTKDIAKMSDGVSVQNINDQDQIVVTKTVSYTGWKLVSVVPKDGYNVSQDKMRYIIVLVISVTILLMLFINQQVSRSITRPMVRLDQIISDMEHEEEPVFDVPGSNEIIHLSKTLQNYSERNKQLMQKVVEEQELKRQSELDALQSQINPHFLYNTLDSVIWMIEDGQNNGAVYMIKELSKLLRISINKGRSLITVRDEIQHAKSYINIQMMRYKDQFTCEFDIAEEILDCCTIKLVVQPLIENAINYGVQGMYDDGEILVKGYKEGEDVFIDVIDNGCGMSQDQIEHIFMNTARESNEPSRKGNGVGLKNVNTRIKMQFGQEYGLKILSELGEGTTMRIHLPYLSYQTVIESSARKEV